MIELNKDTKLKDLLEACPDLTYRLAEVNPKFRMLTSPMRKMMTGRVTVSDISRRCGMEADDLARKIQGLVGGDEKGNI